MKTEREVSDFSSEKSIRKLKNFAEQEMEILKRK
jgi:hypothetical protein